MFVPHSKKTAHGELVEPYGRSYPSTGSGRAVDVSKYYNNNGFTLIEVLISLSLSMLIVIALMQTYRNAVRYLEGTHDIMASDRIICLLFNQLEKDFSTAYIPTLAPLEKPDDKNQAVRQQSMDAKEERLKSFVGQINESIDAVKINTKKLMPLKSISFIATSPLEVYGQHTPRLVRIVYQLSANKEQPNGAESFTLVRKETSDLKNTFAHENDDALRKDPSLAITSHVIAKSIKFLSIEYSYKKKVKSTEGKERKEPARSFTWGDQDKKETIDAVPQSADIYLQLWEKEQTSWKDAHITIPIFSYPTITQDTKTTASAPLPKDQALPQPGPAQPEPRPTGVQS